MVAIIQEENNGQDQSDSSRDKKKWKEDIFWSTNYGDLLMDVKDEGFIV